jgi:hypothetical protein
MTIEDQILEKIRRLTPAEQEEVLRFIEGLHGRKTVEVTWVEENRGKQLPFIVRIPPADPT